MQTDGVRRFWRCGHLRLRRRRRRWRRRRRHGCIDDHRRQAFHRHDGARSGRRCAHAPRHLARGTCSRRRRRWRRKRTWRNRENRTWRRWRRGNGAWPRAAVRDGFRRRRTVFFKRLSCNPLPGGRGWWLRKRSGRCYRAREHHGRPRDRFEIVGRRRRWRRRRNRRGRCVGLHSCRGRNARRGSGQKLWLCRCRTRRRRRWRLPATSHANRLLPCRCYRCSRRRRRIRKTKRLCTWRGRRRCGHGGCGAQRIWRPRRNAHRRNAQRIFERRPKFSGAGPTIFRRFGERTREHLLHGLRQIQA